MLDETAQELRTVAERMRTGDVEDIETRIKKAEQSLHDAQVALRAAQAALDNLYRERSKLKYGVEPGMRVRCQGKEGVVAEVRPDGWAANKPWVYANLIKKDGTVGNKQQCFYGDWEIV